MSPSPWVLLPASMGHSGRTMRATVHVIAIINIGLHLCNTLYPHLFPAKVPVSGYIMLI